MIDKKSGFTKKIIAVIIVMVLLVIIGISLWLFWSDIGARLGLFGINDTTPRSEEQTVIRYSILNRNVEQFQGASFSILPSKLTIQNKTYTKTILASDIESHYYGNPLPLEVQLDKPVNTINERIYRPGASQPGQFFITEFDPSTKGNVHVTTTYFIAQKQEFHTTKFAISSTNSILESSSKGDEKTVNKPSYFEHLTPDSEEMFFELSYNSNEFPDETNTHLQAISKIPFPLKANQFKTGSTESGKQVGLGIITDEDIGYELELPNKDYNLILREKSNLRVRFQLIYKTIPQDIFIQLTQTSRNSDDDTPEIGTQIAQIQFSLIANQIPSQGFKSYTQISNPENEMIDYVNNQWRDRQLLNPFEISYTLPQDEDLTGPPVTKTLSICGRRVDNFLVLNLNQTHDHSGPCPTEQQ